MNGRDGAAKTRPLRRVLILADESANWKVAGLTQLDRLALTLQEFAEADALPRRLEVCVYWRSDIAPQDRRLPGDPRLRYLELNDKAAAFLREDEPIDLVLSTHVFLFRESVGPLLAGVPAPAHGGAMDGDAWQNLDRRLHSDLAAVASRKATPPPWRVLAARDEIPACERAFLRGNGKSQDGLVSRHLNRRVSRFISRGLLKLPLTPSTWSLLIFVLPILAAWEFTRGSYAGFVIGAAIFQLYSILDGCDGEIARAKFMQTEFGRRLDSFLDLIGNMLLALSLGLGLARHSAALRVDDWFYLTEGIATAILIATSEGIVFIRRSRGENVPSTVVGRWNGALYQRHHEFLERSGILFLGDKFAWWLVQLTKRDMAMLGFLILAIVAWPAGILHLQFLVAGLSSALAGNAFLRQPAPALAPEAS